MLALFLFQAIMPLALITWIAVLPAKSVVGFWAQAVAITIGLVALVKVGIWMFPPWWTPFAFGALLALVFVGRTRKTFATHWPQGPLSAIVALGFVAFAIFAANVFWNAIAAARPPAGRTVELAWPLGSGQYLVANGGSTLAINAHADALDQSIVAHRAWHGTAYAVDIVAINHFGFRADGVMPEAPSAYRVFGVPVVAPCAGGVIVALDGLPDMAVPELDAVNLAGNHIILRCGDIDIVMAHFQQGSVQVRAGDILVAGSPIARAGNSGGSSEPHLHIHAQEPGTAEAPLSGAPIPMTFNGRFLVRNDRFIVTQQQRQP